MNCLQTSLYNLLEDNNFVPSKEYKASIASYLHSDSSLTPQAMGKLTGEIFQSKQTMAYYLLHNAINDEAYKDVVAQMHKKLDSLQTYYKVTDKEFETTPKEKVDRTYEAFEKLRGTPIQ